MFCERPWPRRAAAAAVTARRRLSCACCGRRLRRRRCGCGGSGARRRRLHHGLRRRFDGRGGGGALACTRGRIMPQPIRSSGIRPWVAARMRAAPPPPDRETAARFRAAGGLRVGGRPDDHRALVGDVLPGRHASGRSGARFQIQARTARRADRDQRSQRLVAGHDRQRPARCGAQSCRRRTGRSRRPAARWRRSAAKVQGWNHDRERHQQRRQYDQRSPGIADQILVLDLDPVAGRDDRPRAPTSRSQRLHDVGARGDRGGRSLGSGSDTGVL